MKNQKTSLKEKKRINIFSHRQKPSNPYPQYPIPAVTFTNEPNTPTPIKAPSRLTEPMGESRTRAEEENLLIVKQILLANEYKIHKVMQNAEVLYDNVVKMYEQHEKQLRKVVQQRCNQFVSLMRKYVGVLSRKERKLTQMETQVWKYQNTMNAVQESLRLTKIKQDCIQAFLQAKKQKNVWEYEKNHELSESIFSEPKQPDDQSLFFKYESNRVNAPKQIPIVEIVEDDEEYMEQLSPFDTNHLLLGREKSKEKPNPTQYSFNGNTATSFRKIRTMILENGKQELWLDDLGYFRRKNGSYLCDSRGEFIQSDEFSFRKLINEGLIIPILR